MAGHVLSRPAVLTSMWGGGTKSESSTAARHHAKNVKKLGFVVVACSSARCGAVQLGNGAPRQGLLDKVGHVVSSLSVERSYQKLTPRLCAAAGCRRWPGCRRKRAALRCSAPPPRQAGTRRASAGTSCPSSPSALRRALREQGGGERRRSQRSAYWAHQRRLRCTAQKHLSCRSSKPSS